VPAVSLSAIWNENESLFGANWVYGAGLQIPFELNAPGTGTCGTRGGFWGAIKESFRPQRPHLTNRFLEPVRSRSLPLPMQVGTSVQDIKTTTTYQGTFTLPDGSVARLSGSQTSSSSGSGSYAAGLTKTGASTLPVSGAVTYAGTTTVYAGSFQLSGGASVVTSTLASSGTTAPTGGVATGSNSGTSTNTVTTGTTGSSSTTTGVTGTTTITGTMGGTLVINGSGTQVTIPSGPGNAGSLAVGGMTTTGATTTTTTTTTTTGSPLVFNGGGSPGINVISNPGIPLGGSITMTSGGSGSVTLDPGQLITANGPISFSTNSANFTIGGRQFTVGNLSGVSLPASVWGSLLQNLPQGNSFILQNDGSGNYSLVPES
jgi:hypothetical protein